MSKQPDKAPATKVVHRSKVRPVSMPLMRVPPALVTQRPFRASRGNYLRANLDLDKLGLPVINHRDGIYWILDGQHRIYALRENGLGDGLLDCEVYENLTDAEMADIFLGRGNTLPISPFDKFHIACTAGHDRETGIRRAIESQGVKIGRTKEENTVSAVSACGNVFDLGGPIVLGQVMRVIKNGFSGDPAAFDSSLIVGLGHVFNRYNGRTEEKDLTTRLAATPQGVRGLMRRAEAQRERTGNQKTQCVAATIVEIYNKGAGPKAKDKLPSWWSEASQQ